MPLIEYLNIDNISQIITWKVSENNNNLLEILKLKKTQQKKYLSLSQKRKKEYLGVLLCLKLLNMNYEIFYSKNGKPYIKSNYEISISHSYELVSLGVSKYRIGIDIQKKQNQKIINIKNKFIKNSENLYKNFKNESDYLHIIWGIKESLFKLNNGNSWNFLTNYNVEYFNLKKKKPILCSIVINNNSIKYYGFYKKINDYFLVYVLNYLPKK